MIRSASSSLVRLLAGFPLITLFVLLATLLAPGAHAQVLTATTVTSSAGTITLGDTVTFTATVTAVGTPTGIVTFLDGATPLGSAPLNGTPGSDQATFPTSLLSATGSPHSITAIYQGDTTFAGSASTAISETVNPRTSTTGVVLNPTAVVAGQLSTAAVTVTDSGSLPAGTADTFSPTGVPVTGRTGFTATLIADGAVLITSGTDANNKVLQSAEVYAGGSFSATPGNLNTPRTGAVAILLPNAKVLIAGGSSDGTANGALDSAELLDPNTGTFALTSHNMTAARFGATITLLNTGKVLIAGGVNSGGVLNSAELYDPNTDTFTATGSMNASRTGASATLLGTTTNAKVLIAGGSSDGTPNGALNSAEVFDPAGNAGAGTFATVAGSNPTLATGRWQPEAALLLSGKALIAGGQNSGGAQTSADLYDPVADSFTASSQSMSQARANGSAVALPSGMVLLAGGTTSPAVDLYDAESDQFDTTGSLLQSDQGLISTLLNNGDVLVVGLTAATPAADAELYAPSFNPLGTVGVTSSEPTDSITGACTLTPSTTTASTCTSTVTPANVATSPHTIIGTYPADAVHSTSNNAASLTVNKADTTTGVFPSVNPSVFGQSVTFTVTVSPFPPGSGTPTGTVTLTDQGPPPSPPPFGYPVIGAPTLSGGVATVTTSVLAVGSHIILTNYGGDSNYNTSAAIPPQVVNKADTTTIITANTPNPSAVGQPVTVSAGVTAKAPGSGTPTGTVTVSDGVGESCTIILSFGGGSCSITPIVAGKDTLIAHYNGDDSFGSFNASTSTGISQTVASPTTIAKLFNPITIPLNATSTLTFTITNPNSGVALTGIAFADNFPSGVVVAAAPSAGNTCGGTFAPVADATSVTLSAGTLAAGASCAVTVNVQGATPGLKINSVQVTSTEGGPGNTSTASLTVTAAATQTTVTSSANPSVFGQGVTFTGTVTNTSAGSTGTPTGLVQFMLDGVDFGTPVALTGASSNSSTATSQAIATLAVAGSPHSVTAIYINTDGNFINSSGSLSGGQAVTPATTLTTVASSANPSVFGQSVTFTATVADASVGSIAQPTGAVQFVVDGANFGTAVTLTGAGSSTSTATSQATATLSISGSPHSVIANYTNGDGNFINSTGSLGGGQVVNQASATITLAVTPPSGTITLGDQLVLTATVTPPGTGTPTGIVTFFDGTTPLGSAPLNQGSPDQASFSTSLLSTGSHSLTAVYSGDANFAASQPSPPAPVTVNPRSTTTIVALNPTTVSAGQPSAATITVTDAGSIPPGTADSFATTGPPTAIRKAFTSTLVAQSSVGDSLVLVAGGADVSQTPAVVLNSAEFYDTTSGTFNSGGAMNAARTGAVAVLLPNGKVLIAGGSNTPGGPTDPGGSGGGTANGALQTAELFDPNTGTFTLAGGGNASPNTNLMTAARFGATATLLNNGLVLIAGGANSGGVLNSAELYDPTADTFTPTGNLNAARSGASATLLGSGKVLIAGGASDGTANGALTSAETFDPGAGSFTSVAGSNPVLSAKRWQPEATLLVSGKVLIAGGQNSGGVDNTADLYDPVADSFTASAHQMTVARSNGTALALPSGMVLLAGGTTSASVELYDVDSDRFDITGSLLNNVDSLEPTLLNNGRVLAIGVNVTNVINNTPPAVPTADSELYSPSFNPLGTVAFSSSDATDVVGTPCVLTPSTSTTSTCASTVTPIQVGTSPHTLTGTYAADAVHSGSSNAASLTVIPTAPPTIAKAFSVGNAAQNTTVNVSFTIVNPNPASTLTGISFTDALPAGLLVATPNNLNSNCGGTFTAVAGSSSMSLTGGTLAPPGPPPQFARVRPAKPLSPASGQCVITVDLLVTATGPTVTNTTGAISANESGQGNPSNNATLQVVQPPSVNKAFGAASIPLGGTTSLTFNISNPNPSTATFPLTTIPLDGMALTDTLPSGLVVAAPNGLTGSCLPTSGTGIVVAKAGSNSISLSSLNLLAGTSCSFSVNVTGTSGGTQANPATPVTAAFDDGTGIFRPVTGVMPLQSIVVVAPPVISKAFVPPAIAASGVSALTFTITNAAANTVGEAGVAFTDSLPTNVVVATPNGLSASCGGTVTATAGSGSISLVGGSIATSSSCVFSVNVTSSVLGSYTNTTGAVSSTNGGTGNTASATLTVAPASLSITKTHTGNFPRGSSNNNYTITVSASATGGPTVGTVTVTDTLPNVPNTLVPTAMTGTGWTCTLATLTCTRSDSLAAGASYPAITVTVNAPQSIQDNVTNSATVSGGGDANSHTANDPTHIGPPILISSTDSGSVTVSAGVPAVFQFQVDTTGVTPQPAVVTFSCSGLPVGAKCTFSKFPAGQTAFPLTLGITTTGPGSSSTAGIRRISPLFAALMFPVMGLIGISLAGRKGKRTRMRLVLILMGLLLLAALAGCGGGNGVTVTPHGQSTITVTGTAQSAQGPVSGSTTVTLNVQ